jgi:hypothetical protein
MVASGGKRIVVEHRDVIAWAGRWPLRVASCYGDYDHGLPERVYIASPEQDAGNDNVRCVCLTGSDWS